jgi:phosphoribosyl-ATP pyrophosphohydrolase
MSELHPIDRLFATIENRKTASDTASYTASLLKAGVCRCAKKFGEESVEAALAAATGDKAGTIAESADVLYHLLVMWAAAGVTPDEVYAALRARESQSGLEEKASRRT